MGRTKPTVSPEYIVGITDGEGCFYVNVSKSAAYRSGYQIQLHFHLKLQAKDRALLLKIRNTLNCGAVYFQPEKRKNHSQCFRYTVSSFRDISEIIIPFFKKHPLETASKSKSFNAFCDIASIVTRNRHLTRKGVQRIQKIKAQMNKRVGLA